MRRLWNGYWFMGTVQVPPLPPKIVLTDQVTGEQKQLSYDTESSCLQAVSPDDTNESSLYYEVDSGPRFPEDSRYILTLSDGVFSATLTTPPDYETSNLTSCIYARSGTSSRRVCLSEFV